MGGAQKIIFNTGITYARAIVTSLISLYATRLVLQALGASDFGLFNVVGGIIAILAFLNAAMTTSTQRFLSFNLGKGDLEIAKKIFGNSVLIHFALGLIIVLIVEVVGLYLINNHLQIEVDRVEVAKYILHFALASTFLTVISVPYDALINAHEDMSFLAIVSIIESLLKLIVAISLAFLSGDKLFYYGLSSMLVAFIVRIIKRLFVIRKYEESKVNIKEVYEIKYIKELSSFAGWQLFGTLCALGRNQGVSVILNFFYTTVVNAAYGVANQINSQMMFFSQTMMSAVRPQIMKSEGANDRNRMIRLALSANKLAFFLFSFFAIPLYFKMPVLLNIWLKEVPNYTTEFCRAIILLTMANQINMGLMTAVQAIGKIKVYQLVAGGIQLMTLPIGFIFLKMGYSPYVIIIVSFILECLSTIFRVFYFKHLTNYSVIKYFWEVIIKSLLTCLPSVLTLILLDGFIQNNLWGLIICGIISTILYSICIYSFGLDKGERTVINGFLKKFKFK